MVMTFTFALLTTITGLVSLALTSAALTVVALGLGAATLLLVVAWLTDTSLNVRPGESLPN